MADYQSDVFSILDDLKKKKKKNKGGFIFLQTYETGITVTSCMFFKCSH